MRFFSRPTLVASILGDMYKSAQAAAPHWARITYIGRKIGPVVTLTLEIHYGDDPPYKVSTTVFLPRGVTPRIGQDVAYRAVGGENTHYEVLWDQPPHYGTGRGPS